MRPWFSFAYLSYTLVPDIGMVISTPHLKRNTTTAARASTGLKGNQGNDGLINYMDECSSICRIVYWRNFITLDCFV